MLSAIEMVLGAGSLTKTHVLNLLHRPVDERPVIQLSDLEADAIAHLRDAACAVQILPTRRSGYQSGGSVWAVSSGRSQQKYGNKTQAGWPYYRYGNHYINFASSGRWPEKLPSRPEGDGQQIESAPLVWPQIRAGELGTGRILTATATGSGYE